MHNCYDESILRHNLCFREETRRCAVWASSLLWKKGTCFLQQQIVESNKQDWTTGSPLRNTLAGAAAPCSVGTPSTGFRFGISVATPVRYLRTPTSWMGGSGIAVNPGKANILESPSSYPLTGLH